MSTSRLFRKHFGTSGVANLNHPNAEKFFEDLNKECLAEDEAKVCTHPERDRQHMANGDERCEACDTDL